MYNDEFNNNDMYRFTNRDMPRDDYAPAYSFIHLSHGRYYYDRSIPIFLIFFFINHLLLPCHQTLFRIDIPLPSGCHILNYLCRCHLPL